jgi:hypothetical protein
VLYGVIRDYSAFNIHYFKVCPSARCVSGGIAICRNIDILKNDGISLAGIFHSFSDSSLNFLIFFCLASWFLLSMFYSVLCY